MSVDSGDHDKPAAPPTADGDDHYRFGSLTSDLPAGTARDRGVPADRSSTAELPLPGLSSSPESAQPLWMTQPLATELPGAADPPISPPLAGGSGVPGSTRSASAPLSAQGPPGHVPTGPPPRYRPNVVPSSGGGSSPFLSVPSSGPGPGYGSGQGYGVTTRHEAVAPIVRPASGWGWRALVAFVAGGLLTATGFAVAQLNRNDDTLAASEAGSTTTSEPVPVSTEAPPSSAAETSTTTASPITGDPVEPAVGVAEVLSPSVVQVETNFGIGSGVVYGDGLIITNAHVVDGANEITVQLSDGQVLPGQILGVEPRVDIAVVSVGEGRDLPVATLATGETVRVGQTAIAIGSPFSLQQSVTEGIVSAVDRPIRNRDGTSFVPMIQTDAPINPGNSGGALADVGGRVIGINTAIQTDGSSGNNAGVGFAIPIDTAVSVADRLVAGIPIEEGFLGIRGDQPEDGAAGVEVFEVTEDSAAQDAGLLVGDRIIAIDGAPVTQFDELAGLVMTHVPGDVIELDVIRNGGEMVTIQATLAARPEDG